MQWNSKGTLLAATILLLACPSSHLCHSCLRHIPSTGSPSFLCSEGKNGRLSVTFFAPTGVSSCSRGVRPRVCVRPICAAQEPSIIISRSSSRVLFALLFWFCNTEGKKKSSLTVLCFRRVGGYSINLPLLLLSLLLLEASPHIATAADSALTIQNQTPLSCKNVNNNNNNNNIR